ncbi:MAG: hypothetical protein WCN97_03880 [Thermoleophilia bacterium]
MSNIRTTQRLRRVALVLVGAAVLIAAPTATGSAWSVSGPLRAPTSPLLGGGSADTPTAVALAYDPSTQALQLRLDFTAPPSRNGITVDMGTAQPDGTCATGGLSIGIVAQDHMVTTTTTQTVRTWVPPRTEVGWSYSSRYPPGSGTWTYLGYDSWTMRHQWLHSIPGYWVQESRDVTSSGPDASTHERVAGLSLSSADGILSDTEVVTNDSTAIEWHFTSPLLENAAATCVAVHVANRRAPFLLTPGPVASTGAAGSAVAATTPMAASAPRARARRIGRTLHLRLRGHAGAVQVRIGTRSTPPLPYADALSLQLGAQNPRSIAVRFKTDATWSGWRTVPISSSRRRG